ncbi:response regulator transcription factor [Micromonospora sp. CPCC 206060]|uniref:response regulator transcription factor n=1 Tax=Micromonospora sp. CPCC 206060 TaxID=3122406 RepID=UPI002FEF9206
MIRTLLALDGALIRGALALVLAAEHDIRVVAEVDRDDNLDQALWTQLPDVAVVDADLIAVDNPAPTGPCPLLVLADPRRPRGLYDLLCARRAVGILGNDVSPQRVVDGVRRLARGEPLVDADLVVAALGPTGPLTGREADVLDLAATGSPVSEIARRLSLSPGTVRNHLGRIKRKTGARTRIEAVRVAQNAGWI